MGFYESRATLLTLLTTTAMSGLAFGQETLRLQSQAPSTMRSQVSFGYGIESSTSRGFRQAGGSLLALDLTYRLTPAWHLGLRTLGNGGEEDGQRFYRMASGPLAVYELNKDWQFSGGIGVYSETGYMTSQPTYHSRGLSYSLGWQRNFALAPSARLGLGGFFVLSQGAWTAADLSANAGPHSGSHQSLTRGISVSLEMALF